MKQIIIFLLLAITLSINGQNPTDSLNKFTYPLREKIEKPYHPEENAEQQLAKLIVQAKKEHKNIFIQAGGNWCGWCLRFNYFVHNEPDLKQIIDKNYLYYHLNYSPENRNETVFNRYIEKEKRYGYPFFIILSGDGKLLCVQESGILEEDKGYNTEKVKQFLLKHCP
ncbi:MAG: thioredoxin family protein [Paludibacteraceae bacterium]